MRKLVQSKIFYIISIFLIVIFFNPYSYVEAGEGADVTSSDITWAFTWYTGTKLPTGFTESDFTKDDKYGWCLYESGGVQYVVLAAATIQMLNSPEYPELTYLHTRLDRLHYFYYYETIQFKFVDSSFDSNVYNAIILDSCGVSMNPQREGKHAEGVQILDVYMGSSGSKPITNFSGDDNPIVITETGVFSSSAGTSSSATKRTYNFKHINSISSIIR